MKLNKKGFLLTETIVTICVIATLATSMYVYISSASNRFEDRNSYENVTDVYKTNTLKKYLTEKDELNLDGINYKDITGDISSIKNELNITKAYLIKNTNAVKSELITSISDQAFIDYLKWIKIDDSDDLRLVVWFYENPEDTFANMVIK